MHQNPVNREQGAIYARLSQNRGGLSTNCAVQAAECRAYGTEQGVEIAETFSDDDISASRYSSKPRPDYVRLLRAVEDNQVQVIYVTELSRLYRRIEELLVLIRLAETTGLRRIETTDGELYQLDTAEGRHRAVGAVNNAQLESERASRRQKRKKAAQAALGMDNGGERPYGYEPDRHTIRESEAKVLREMVRRYVTGQSTTQIAYWLNEKNYKMARGGQWGSINVRNLLKSKRIGGIRTHNGAEYPAIWPAIIDSLTFDRLQLEIELRAADPSAVPKGRKYLLTGLAYCGKCGGPMTGNIRKDHPDKPKKRYYVCRLHGPHNRNAGCGRTRRYAVPLEHFIKELVAYRLDSPDLAHVLGEIKEDSSIKPLLERKAVLSERKKLLSEHYGKGDLDLADFTNAKRANDSALKFVEDRLMATHRRIVSIDVDPGKTIREAWDGAESDEWRRRLMSVIIERIDLLPGRDSPPYYIDGVRYRFEPARVAVTWRV